MTNREFLPDFIKASIRKLPKQEQELLDNAMKYAYACGISDGMEKARVTLYCKEANA